MNKIQYPLKKNNPFGKNQPYSKHLFEKKLFGKNKHWKKKPVEKFEKQFFQKKKKTEYFLTKNAWKNNLMQKNRTPSKKQQHIAKCKKK